MEKFQRLHEENTVTVPSTLDAAGWLRNHLDGDDGDSDLARSMLQAFAEALMSAEASMQCQAGYNERSEERTNSRNGYRERRWDTRVGSIDLAVPKLREGTYYPAWLLTHRRRAEQALASVVAQAYVEGVSTRRVDDLVKAMGIEGISRSEASREVRCALTARYPTVPALQHARPRELNDRVVVRPAASG